MVWAAALPLNASDWPQWRGPKRDGHSPETGLLQEWTKDGPRLLWQVKDIGSGYSTPSVVGERIYLLSNEGLENEFALALSVKDGRRIWSGKLGKVGHPKQDPNYPAARSTPTVNGNLLYALGSDGDLVCFEAANGNEKWRKNLQSDFGGRYGEWAYAESPLVDGGALICTPGNSNAMMVALNKTNGNVIWKCSMPESQEAAYGSIVVGEFAGMKQYVQFLAAGLVGVNAKSGKLLWRYERSAKGSPAVIMTPLVSDGYVYSGAFRSGGALIKPVKKDGGFKAEEIYFNIKLPTGLGGVVKVGDFLYGTSGRTLTCVEFMSGAIKWQESTVESSLLFADGRLYLHAENGEVALVEPSPDAYREKGRFLPPNPPADQGPSKAWAYPVVADGRLYIRESNCVWCYGIKAGK
jgi:outer membrane protein assembly factor BamB